MVYVDLNPIRAGVANTLEKSNFTSIQERLKEHAKRQSSKFNEKTYSTKNSKYPNIGDDLLRFITCNREINFVSSRFRLSDYINLIGWASKYSKAAIPARLPAEIKRLLIRLQVDSHEWIMAIRQFEIRFFYAIGSMKEIEIYRKKMAKQWIQGKRSIRNLYRYSLGA